MWVVRLIIMLIIAALSVFSYCTECIVNPITGEEQHEKQMRRFKSPGQAQRFLSVHSQVPYFASTVIF